MAVQSPQKASHTLSAVLYMDEVTPGNVLRPDNRRKFWAFYFGFLEVGSTSLCREQFWLPLGVLRTCIAHDVKGGVSYAVRALLRSLLIGPCRLADIGCPVVFSTGPRLVQASITNIIADEAALKALWSAKGAAGLRCCILCRNVVSLHADLTTGQDYLVDVSCSDASRFDLAEDQDIWDTWDKLAAKRNELSKVAFGELEKACGFTYSENSILSDRELRRFIRPATVTTMDWLHNWLQNGVASQEVAAFLAKSKAALGIDYSHLEQFVTADWRFPRAQSTHKADAIFSSARERSSGDAFRATGSELLLVLPLLRHFATTTVEPTKALPSALRSFFKMCEVVDLLLAHKHGRRPSTDVVAAMGEHLQLHKEAHGLDYVKPKHHFGFHNGFRCVGRSGSAGDPFLDCFVHERKHQVVKTAGTSTKNTSRYEASVLSRVLLEQKRQLAKAVADGLLGTEEVLQGAAHALGDNVRVAKALWDPAGHTHLDQFLKSHVKNTFLKVDPVFVQPPFSKALQVDGLSVGVGDIVLFGTEAAVVRACCRLSDGSLALLLTCLQRVSQGRAHSVWRQKPGEGLSALPLHSASDIVVPYAWAPKAPGSTLVLHAA